MPKLQLKMLAVKTIGRMCPKDMATPIPGKVKRDINPEWKSGQVQNQNSIFLWSSTLCIKLKLFALGELNIDQQPYMTDGRTG